MINTQDLKEFSTIRRVYRRIGRSRNLKIVRSKHVLKNEELDPTIRVLAASSQLPRCRVFIRGVNKNESPERSG